MTERDVLRLILGYQDAWFAQFPLLARRAEWHILHHLATKGRNGAAAAELYGLVKQVFLLDDATVKERLTSLSQMGLCQLDPPGQIFARTVAIPTDAFLARFDAHLIEFGRTLSAIGGHPPLSQGQPVTALWRAQALRPLETYGAYWATAIDAIFDHTGLSPARRSDARRHLLSSSHWNLLHIALRWHYDAAPEATPILADRLAARILDLTGQTVQTTKDHIGYLIEVGLFRRSAGRALHIVPSDVALHFIGWALRQTAAELGPMLDALAAAAPPAPLAVPAQIREADASERTLNIKPNRDPALPEVAPIHVLEVVVPAGTGQRFEIRPPVTIGRTAPAEVVLARSDVSRSHCRIDAEGNYLIVSDLNSTNGTYVNDVPVKEVTRLHAGDRLRVGSVVLQYDTEAPSVETTQRGVAPDSTVTLHPKANKSGNSGI